MTFKYKLQRVLDLREQELEKVKVKFQEAAMRVRETENKIKKNRQDQLDSQRDLITQAGLSAPLLYTNRLKYLKSQMAVLEEELIEAKEALAFVRQEMLEAQQKMEALEKHKEKLKAEYDKAELKKEENDLNELALIMTRIKKENAEE
jgi:flagellar FliJ protein